MDIKNDLTIKRFQHPVQGWECIKLNMSIKSLLDAVSPDDDNFWQNLSSAGIELDAPIIALPQDVEDYLVLDNSPIWDNEDDDDKESERLRTIYNILNNLIYEDEEFTDEVTGKKGLKDQFGNIVVPALFDSCRGACDMTQVCEYAIVEKNGKFYRTPRDGSGNLIDDEGYDRVYLNGEVIRDGKHGKVSMRTPQILIPCEMDWMAYDDFYEILFSRDGKLGMRDTYLHKYIPPVYSAYDITTLRFCRDGVWGWVNRETGEFFTEPIGNRYDVMIAACNANSYLSHDDKPVVEQEEKYISIEEMHKQLLQGASEFKKTLKIKLSSLIELPPLKYKKDYKASSRIVDAIRSLTIKNNKLIVRSEDGNAPEMHTTYSTNEGRNVYRLEWSPRSNALAWHDVALKELNAFHQLLLPGKDTFSMHFYRDFTGRQVQILAKFIAYYYAKIWQISEDELVIVDYL